MAHMMEDEDAQRMGLVMVVYNIGLFHLDEVDPELMKNGSNYTACLPMRFAAVHYCFSDPRLLPAISLARMVVRKNTRLRFRAHYGSPLECQYELVTFGIKRSILPLDSSGALSLADFEERLRTRRAKEAEFNNSSAGRIDYPKRVDVVLGRGRPYQEYIGNIHLASIIERNKVRYKESQRGQKSVVSSEIVRYIQGMGGRFLKRNEENNTWVEVSEQAAIDKVGHGFRTKTRRDDT